MVFFEPLSCFEMIQMFEKLLTTFYFCYVISKAEIIRPLLDDSLSRYLKLNPLSSR